MKFDLITIFPEFFAPLELSLLGKAQQSGQVSVDVHNLRDWATGKHLAVDDAPVGGGAGMVMRADVWGRALDQVIQDSGHRVLAIPTPGGTPLTQVLAKDLASANQIIVACGRYEGIDFRVSQHYRSIAEREPVDESESFEVLEFSLGDYVLNGGEVAALALVEAVSRLVEGVVGNPESLVEESHSADGLLEYPVFTQPRQWRGEKVPAVLLSGNHAKIDRWRRDQALRKTATVRPDMISRLATRPCDERGRPEGLDGRDLEVLAEQGFVMAPRPGKVSYRVATHEDLEVVSSLASSTFPLACPPGTREEEIAQFVEENLTVQAFRNYMDRDGGRICVATVDLNSSGKDGSSNLEVVAYTLCFPELPDGIQVEQIPAVYVSKCYTAADWHGSGVSGALLEYALADAFGAWGAKSAVLGTNQGNRRATRFYRNHGFRKSGTRTFRVGATDHRDFVFVRDLTEDQAG